MKTPLAQIKLQSCDGIAERTQFSEVMCDTLALDLPKRLLDIGCGSGVIGIFCLLNGSDYAYFNDIQGDAIELARQNLQLNQIPAEQFEFFNGPFQDIDLNHCQFDAVAFNPPQLPTEMVSMDNFSDHREKIFRDGGPNGLKLIEQYIDWLPGHLPIDGKAYLGISSMLLIDDLLEKVSYKGLQVEKRFYRQVPLREIFYPQLETMSQEMIQARELTRQDDKWYKKIYTLEFKLC